MGNIKINRLEIENVKRIKAVKIEPTQNGLTVIGGDNNQGKTSVLDAIAWALGGEKYRPSKAQREDSVTPPYLHVVLSNGMVVERKGKNSDLKVTDPTGSKGGQQMLNEFVEQFALDLPKFIQSSDKDKAKTLLNVIGVGSELTALEQREKQLYNERLAIGRIADQKKKFANEQPYYPEAPKSLVSPSELIRKQQEILARNGENQRKRNQAEMLQRSVDILRKEVEAMTLQLREKEDRLMQELESLRIAQKSAQDLQDESTAELEENIASIEEINRKVRANLDKEKAEEDAQIYADQYSTLTQQIADARDEKTRLLDNAQLPLPGLSVQDGDLIYNGQKWDNMSGSQRLIVSTAIVRKLNPKCGFVLLDQLEQMDRNTLIEFGRWLEQEGLQAIATRVSTGDECSIIITDGYADGRESLLHPDNVQIATNQKKQWRAGEF